ncbi:hypothetical protein AXF42_Ash006804 [Apostasia shenzhenica]|uniref:Retrotransposon gag domain-containing protein n=1 Tax=Apostasia shenzhenica TaxID=1088818 RepID=A0A2I0AJ59_9ASPA|nr:hypothetical protein AXF42_Ash006804 [Apostasia shenzhenica]
MCMTMHYPHVTIDAIRLRLMPFALKDNAKKWLYSLGVNSIGTWDDFIKVFLKKYFPNGKTVRLRNEINQFVQLDKETLWKYIDRFKNLLAQCPHHGIEKWRLCQILYEGMDYSTRTMVESICQGEFLAKNVDEAWDFLEELADKSLQWETTREQPSLASKISSKGGIYTVPETQLLEAKIAAIDQQLRSLNIQQNQNQNLIASSCSYCHALNHTLSSCPSFANQLSVEPEQANLAYARPKNDPFALTYNPGWRNHPNFSWNQGNSVPNINTNVPQFSSYGNLPAQNFQHTQRPQMPPLVQTYMPPGFNETERRLGTLERSQNNLEKTLHNVSSQLAQLLVQTREKGTLPSQPEPNPRNQVVIRDPSSSSEANRGINAVITLRLGRQINNKVGTPEELKEDARRTYLFD